MGNSPKEVTCKCGHVLEIEKESTWCDKCGEKVYIDAKKGRYYKMNHIYFYLLLFGSISFLTYLFIELIINPVLKFKM